MLRAAASFFTPEIRIEAELTTRYCARSTASRNRPPLDHSVATASSPLVSLRAELRPELPPHPCRRIALTSETRSACAAKVMVADANRQSVARAFRSQRWRVRPERSDGRGRDVREVAVVRKCIDAVPYEVASERA